MLLDEMSLAWSNLLSSSREQKLQFTRFCSRHLRQCFEVSQFIQSVSFLICNAMKWFNRIYNLLSRQIRDMDKCVVKRGENVSDAENFIAFTHLRSELNLDLFGLLLLSLTRCHFAVKFQKFEAEMVLSTPQKHTKGSSSAETEARQKLYSVMMCF